ncbi:hypothetical protein GCM10023158_07030 [Gluconacetobacter tumulicola]
MLSCYSAVLLLPPFMSDIQPSKRAVRFPTKPLKYPPQASRGRCQLVARENDLPDPAAGFHHAVGFAGVL